MKLLVLGDDGWLGNKFKVLLKELGIEYITTKVRIDNIGFESEIIRIAPTHVISFIGRTVGYVDGKYYGNIDYLEQPCTVNENVRDNLFAPVILSIMCNKHNIHFTYIATGCIFAYDKFSESNKFTERDIPNFFGSNYSIVKGYTDQILQLHNKALILRVRMPITSVDEPRNLITKLTSYSKICSNPNSMSVLDDLFPIIVDMIDKNVTGTFNFTNPGFITHNDILAMYKEIVNPSFTWTNFSTEEQNTVLDSKRCNNYLCTEKIEKLYPNLLNIKDSVRNILTKLQRGL